MTFFLLDCVSAKLKTCCETKHRANAVLFVLSFDISTFQVKVNLSEHLIVCTISTRRPTLCDSLIFFGHYVQNCLFFFRHGAEHGSSNTFLNGLS